MADLSHGPSSFWTQANALLRKNLTFQKRNMRTNVRLILFPFVLCLLLVLIQSLVNTELNKPSNKCGCTCIDTNGDGQCERVCGIEYSTLKQGFSCPIRSPPQWPPLLQIPAPEYRAVRTDFFSHGDLPNESCKITGSCPATILLTGNNHSLGQSLGATMFRRFVPQNFSNDNLPNIALGSESQTEETNFLDPAFFSNLPVYYLQNQCAPNSTFSLPIQVASIAVQQEVRCAQGLHLWRNSSSEINDELYKGYRKGNSERKINEIIAGYNLLNSNANNFNVSIWYNSTYKNDTGSSPIGLMRVPRSVNLDNRLCCRFFKWCDPPFTERSREVILQLKEKIERSNEQIESLMEIIQKLESGNPLMSRGEINNKEEEVLVLQRQGQQLRMKIDKQSLMEKKLWISLVISWILLFIVLQPKM